MGKRNTKSLIWLQKNRTIVNVSKYLVEEKKLRESVKSGKFEMPTKSQFVVAIFHPAPEI